MATPIRLSFFVELPFDVGLPNDSTVTLFEGDAPIEGWESTKLSPLPSTPELPEPGVWKGTSLWFRRSHVSGSPALKATEKAFGRVLSAVGHRPTWRWRVRRFLAPAGVRGRATHAVVQITRICVPPGPLDMGFVSDEFDHGLDKLNDYLIAVSLVSQDWAIRPVSLRDLPMVIPYATSSLDGGSEELAMMILHHHEQIEADLLTPEQAEHAANIVARQHGQGHPFFPFGEALVEARHALARGRSGQGVLEAEIAWEVAVAAVVRELSATEEDAVNVLQSGLVNIVSIHLPRLAGVTVDLEDASNPYGAWRQDAYTLRNRVVHEGYRPSQREAQDALAAVKRAIDDLALGLSRDPTKAELGQMLVASRDR